jgi:thiol-disulfide isomerase/thioredoxin
MKKMMLCVLFVLTLAAPLLADTGIWFKHESVKEILERGKKENIPVFIDAYASWCGPCRMMAEQTFTDTGVAKYMNENFMSLKIDVESEEGKLFQEQYAIEFLPTSFFFDKTGELKVKETGYQDAASFLTLARRALGVDLLFNEIGELESKYAAGDSSMPLLTKLMMKKIEARNSEGLLPICLGIMRRTEPEALKVDTFFYAYYVVQNLDYNHPYNVYFRTNYDQLFAVHGNFAHDKAIELVAQRTTEAGIAKDKKMRKEAWLLYKKVHPGAKKKAVREVYREVVKLQRGE